MKREVIQNVVNSVLATAVVVLFVLFFTLGRKGGSCEAPQSAAQPQEVVVNGEHLPIAVVNTDSIFTHYQFAIDGKDRLESQAENERVKLGEQAKSFQKEMETLQNDVIAFQKKVDNNAFISRERAESEANKIETKRQQLLNKQQELEYKAQQKEAELMNKQADFLLQVQDSVQAFLDEYNADGHLHLIVNDAVVLDKVAGYDITSDVIEGLNARYKK